MNANQGEPGTETFLREMAQAEWKAGRNLLEQEDDERSSQVNRHPARMRSGAFTPQRRAIRPPDVRVVSIDCWDIVGCDVMAALEDFGAGQCHMDRLNRAYMVLLSKVQGAKQIGDFHPISLSNSLYLIFTKVLANRLWGVLLWLISPF